MSKLKRESWQAWAFLGPALALIAIFIVLPFAISVVLSFTDQRLVPNPNVPTKFVGWRNYLRLFESGEFMNAFWRTATFAVLVVPLQCAMGLGAAILINSTLPTVLRDDAAAKADLSETDSGVLSDMSARRGTGCLGRSQEVLGT